MSPEFEIEYLLTFWSMSLPFQVWCLMRFTWLLDVVFLHFRYLLWLRLGKKSIESILMG